MARLWCATRWASRISSSCTAGSMTFDLLELDGVDLRPFPLERRKDQLRKLLLGCMAGIQFNEHLEDDGATVFAHACRLGCEGIVSKDRSRPYKSGPSRTWIAP